MTAHIPFMAWIDKLSDVDDPIRRDRDKLRELARQVTELERHAADVRERVRASQGTLLTRAMKHWSLAEIQAAERAHPLNVALAQVPDTALRDQLLALDGWHLASEALQAFDAARIIRQRNLLSTASDEERRKTLARVLAWWNHAAKPVCERLALK